MIGVQNICPEKGEAVKQAYASLLTFTVECIRSDFEEEIKNFLTKHNFKPDRIEYYLKVLNVNKAAIVKSLENCSSGWPNLIDTSWRLDYVVKVGTI